MLMTTAIEEFVLHLEAEKGASPGQVLPIVATCVCSTACCPTQPKPVRIEDVTVAAARSWTLDMKGRGLSSGTIARRGEWPEVGNASACGRQDPRHGPC